MIHEQISPPPYLFQSDHYQTLENVPYPPSPEPVLTVRSADIYELPTTRWHRFSILRRLPVPKVAMPPQAIPRTSNTNISPPPLPQYLLSGALSHIQVTFYRCLNHPPQPPPTAGGCTNGVCLLPTLMIGPVLTSRQLPVHMVYRKWERYEELVSPPPAAGGRARSVPSVTDMEHDQRTSACCSLFRE